MISLPYCVVVNKTPPTHLLALLKDNEQFFGQDFIHRCMEHPTAPLKSEVSSVQTAQAFYEAYTAEMERRLEPVWDDFFRVLKNPLAVECDHGLLVIDEQDSQLMQESVKSALKNLALNQPEIQSSIPSFSVQVDKQRFQADSLLEISAYLLLVKQRVFEEGRCGSFTVHAHWNLPLNQVCFSGQC